jgi:hypothetical protein
MVSPQDAALIQNHVWTAVTNSKSISTIYAMRGGLKNRKNRTILLHQQILPGAIEVDHKNLNGLDNRRENLRLADRSLNRANRTKAAITNPSSIFKGASHNFRQGSKPWLARCGGKYLGWFATEIEAARAYDNAARELYGPFARANFAPEK